MKKALSEKFEKDNNFLLKECLKKIDDSAEVTSAFMGNKLRRFKDEILRTEPRTRLATPTLKLHESAKAPSYNSENTASNDDLDDKDYHHSSCTPSSSNKNDTCTESSCSYDNDDSTINSSSNKQSSNDSDYEITSASTDDTDPL